ncbi:phosphatase PAP2 family protein [Rhodoferax sp.]|uniref:phosphatase PAP2 family protein n=1 Tax=Rhodoferax sp. TaxID=50421 RepID=UPI00284845F7|nr:phosphatase PAP2 family protein [Rhodoferax sp.]MDR3371315.1 phosphatase PAP2 family protein [Rhodoferax sp.]
MNLIESYNRSLFLMINGDNSAPRWLVDLATLVGDGVIYLIPLLLIGLWLWGNTRQRKLAVKAFAVAMLGVGLNQLIGVMWQHPRPFMLGLGHTWIVHAADSSFPSDHVTVLTAIGLSLLLDGATAVACLTLTMALAVAWARVFLGVHFPLDMLGAVVVAGVSLGSVAPIWQRFGSQATGLAEQLYRRLLAWPISAGWVKS